MHSDISNKTYLKAVLAPNLFSLLLLSETSIPGTLNSALLTFWTRSFFPGEWEKGLSYLHQDYQIEIELKL